MKPKIIAINKGHLEQLIDKEIADNGCYCDLNHIDVSSVTNMRGLFYCSNFKGNISEWDVSNVEEMSYMFSNAEFNGDISKWDVSKVVDMDGMFHNSHFNGVSSCSIICPVIPTSGSCTPLYGLTIFFVIIAFSNFAMFFFRNIYLIILVR
jgi:surface protein